MTKGTARPLVFFGLDERLVDELLDRIASCGFTPEACLVFGTDMALLGALASQWSSAPAVVIVHMAQPSQTMLQAADIIIEREGVKRERVVWLQAPELGLEPPAGVFAAVCDLAAAREIELRLIKLLG
jgi:hypothetical protein